MLVGVCRLTLHAAHSQSLKAKRAVVRRLRDKVMTHYKVAVSEVDAQDAWQRAVVGFAVVGTRKDHVEATMEKIVRAIESLGEASIVNDERDVIPYTSDTDFERPMTLAEAEGLAPLPAPGRAPAARPAGTAGRSRAGRRRRR